MQGQYESSILTARAILALPEVSQATDAIALMIVGRWRTRDYVTMQWARIDITQ